MTRQLVVKSRAKCDSFEQVMSISEQSAKSRDQLSAPISYATKGPKDTHSLTGPNHQAHIEMEEVTTPIKLRPISMALDGVD